MPPRYQPRLKLSDGTEYDQPGKIAFLDNTIDPSTGTIAVYSEFANPQLKLVPGQFVQVTVQAGESVQLPVVPASAILQDQQGAYVFGLGDGNRAEIRRVTLGQRVGTDWAVTAGLAQGEMVIVSGIQKVQAGIAVDPAAGGELTMFADIFINRPRLAMVIAIIITLAGTIALLNIPVAQYPDITPPTVQVSASYPGADAQTLAETVAAPIEQQVNGVQGMIYMASTTSSSGLYTLTVTFAVGTDPDIAQVNVQNRVALATPLLPDAVTRLGVNVRAQQPNFLLIANVFSPKGTRTGCSCPTTRKSMW